MIYTPLTRIAMRIAVDAHKGQVDKGGFPYINHPLHIAEKMLDELSCTAALLHDVIEDSHFTIDDLRQLGIPERVLEALNLLTHKDDVPYMEYIQALSHDQIARMVKIADLEHNVDMSRLCKKKVRQPPEKYIKALRHLNNSPDYLFLDKAKGV